jgi:hypothetical protein
MKKLIHEEFMARVIEKNEHVRNGEIEILGKYVNQRTPIRCICHIHNNEWNAWVDNLYLGCGCPLCRTNRTYEEQIIPYDEFIKRTFENNKLVKSGNIEILGKYQSMNQRIECKCNIHNVIWSPKAANLANGSGCPKCAMYRIKHAKLSTHEEFVKKVDKLNNGIKVIGEYIDSKTPITFQCQEGHMWSAKPNSILNGSGCPYCSNKKVLVGYNDLFTTHRSIAKLLKNQEDGYKYTYGSKKKLDLVCPDCGKISNKSIKEVCRIGFFCDHCADHISWPNKFARAVLRRCGVDGLEYEWNPEWLKPYAFDNKFISKDGAIVVCELDGSIGHGNKIYGTNEQDVSGLIRDTLKDTLAKEHNVQVVRIDCCYENNNRFEYVKQHILDSELSSVIDLSNIDWAACNAEALSSLVVQSANLYNDGYAVFEIANMLGYCKATITNWLKQASEVGLCLYDKSETRKRGRKTLCRIINQYTLDGIYIKTYNSLAEAACKTGILYNDIWCCCKHIKYHKSAGGFIWFYSDDENQPDKTQIISTIQN